MKLIINAPQYNTVEFAQIESGGLFEWYGDFYLKCENFDEDETILINAVSVNGGVFVAFVPFEQVTPVYGVLDVSY